MCHALPQAGPADTPFRNPFSYQGQMMDTCIFLTVPGRAMNQPDNTGDGAAFLARALTMQGLTPQVVQSLAFGRCETGLGRFCIDGAAWRRTIIAKTQGIEAAGRIPPQIPGLVAWPVF